MEKKICILDEEREMKEIGKIVLETSLWDNEITTELTLALKADDESKIIEELRAPITLMGEELDSYWGQCGEGEFEGYRIKMKGFRSEKHGKNSVELAKEYAEYVIQKLREAIKKRKEMEEFIKKHEKEVIELYL